MAFNVQNIISSLNKTGVAKASHVEVQITPPPKLDLGSTRDLMFRVDSVELPGRTVQTIDHKFINYGPINKVAYAPVYGDVSISFILSNDLREKYYIEQWQDLMIDTDALTEGTEPMRKFNAQYFDDYVGTVDIRQYNESGKHTTTHKLIQAYPIIINPISMGWNESDIARMTVQFAYRYYKVEKDGISTFTRKELDEFELF